MSVPDFPPVLVISLPGETGRRRGMAEKLAAAGIAFNFLDAVDGRRTDVDQQPIYNGPQRRLFYGRDLMGGEIGVLLSHKAALQRVVEGDAPCALILEDDVVFDPTFPEVVRALAKNPDAWELVRFFGDAKHDKRRQRRLLPLTGGFWLTRLATSPGEAHAYLVSKTGARKLLRCLNRTSTPIDTMMGQPWKTGLAALAVHPGLARQDQTLGTSIHADRFEKKPTTRGFTRLVLPVTRTALKLSENVLKRVWYYGAWWADRRIGQGDDLTDRRAER